MTHAWSCSLGTKRTDGRRILYHDFSGGWSKRRKGGFAQKDGQQTLLPIIKADPFSSSPPSHDTPRCKRRFVSRRKFTNFNLDTDPPFKKYQATPNEWDFLARSRTSQSGLASEGAPCSNTFARKLAVMRAPSSRFAHPNPST